MMGYYYDNFWGGFGWFMPFFMIIFWGLLIWGLIYLVRSSGGEVKPKMNGNDGRALEILKERFAKGDISKEEFEEKKKILSA